ncbi:kinase-like protein [Peniophora sp. CONT]|nr:kinase-like protein [Peniophora sp. CONT]
MLSDDEVEAQRRRFLARMEQRRRQMPLLRRLFERWLKPWITATKHSCDGIISRLWKATFGRRLWAKFIGSHSLAHSEIAAMRFVREHTNIPVPRSWGLWRWPWSRRRYIIMDRVPGVELAIIWDHLDDAGRDHIVQQLATYVTQLRELSSPHGLTICSINGGPVADPRLPPAHGGPFPDEQDFNAALRCFRPLESLPSKCASAHLQVHPVVFTHGDIAPRNIMVDPESLRISALLDWGCAGWLPAHWEYRKALWMSWGPLKKTWNPRVAHFIPAYPLEADADEHLVELFWSPLL